MAVGERSEHVRWATPEYELDRRWREVRANMAEHGIDALLIHNHVDSLGGYVKYFSDLSASGGYPLSVIFPAEGPMALVMHGPHGQERDVSGDPSLYGVERVLTTWSFSSASYTAEYDAEQIVRVLREHAGGRIGLVGLAQMPYRLVAHVKEELPDTTFLDAADVVDPVKAIKSPYEREAIARSVALQVAAFEAALEAIEPGRTEWDVSAAAQAVAREGGSEHGPIMVGAGPPGEPVIFKPPRNQTRVLQRGDRLTILVEPAGPDGIYSELGRTIVIGSADEDLLAEHEFAVQAWRHCATAIRPGASARGVAADYNAFLREHGRPEEKRVHCHGQGYDIVERPLVRSDEPMELAEGMLLALHPMYVHRGAVLWVCDNVFVEAGGVSPPLHGVEQKVFEV
ncbi:MAG TPA: M24 family metallopeptidase [Solirubrobacteraceae bacterium]|nr:M24 family metallopeptidase [Solirubrobacteraceae bacterium]